MVAIALLYVVASLFWLVSRAFVILGVARQYQGYYGWLLDQYNLLGYFSLLRCSGWLL